MTERRWAIRRITAGDYLLPSNDLQTLWRITRGEDPNFGTWWDLWRWRGTVQGSELDIAESIEDSDWSQWKNIASPRTRKDAIEEAMRLS